MKIYNTLSRSVEDIKTLKAGQISLYSCGPTVYDYMHIGNLRKFVFDDSLRRALQAAGYSVRQAMNITDVGHLVSDGDEGDDKLEKGASREGKTVWEVAQHYINAFKNDVKALNILPPNIPKGKGEYSRATDFIPQQIEMVQILLDKDFAYQTEQAIYFDVTKLPSYGELTGQSLADKEVAVRNEVVSDPNKRNPHDFGLWFFTVGRFSNHDMRWESPWGEGFPGWHLECSAIIHTVLGDPIDIHTGGVDNIGTHHVNEMAQTEAAYGHRLANYWVHSEHMLVDGQKMSKSLNNFLTLKNVVDKGYDPLALRLLYLQSHYRTQTNFTWESLQAAQNSLSGLRAWADLAHQPAVIKEIDSEKLLSHISQALSNDLATPQVLVALNKVIDHKPEIDLLQKLDTYLGLGLSGRPDIPPEQKQLIDQREIARKTEDWAKADAVRQQLIENGIEIKDTPIGPLWQRTKT